VWIPGTNKFLPFLDIFSMKLLKHPFPGALKFDLYRLYPSPFEVNDTSAEAGQGISATTPLSKGWRCGKIMKDPLSKQSKSTAFYNSLKVKDIEVDRVDLETNCLAKF